MRGPSGVAGAARSGNAPSRAALLARVARLRRLAYALDASIGLPGTPFRFGLDSIAGLLPGGGDLAMALVALYIVKQARDLGVPAPLLRRMLANIAVDALVGTVPVLGDLFDAGFKANLRNVGLIEAHFANLT